MEETNGYGAQQQSGGGCETQKQSADPGANRLLKQPPSPYVQPDNLVEAPPMPPDLGNGVNLQPSYYEGGQVDLGWNLMSQFPKIVTVRIEIEPGQETNAQRWIKEATARGYSVIATYHKFEALASDNPADLIAAADWWVSNYPALRKAGPFVVNLMNEWGSHGITAHDYAASCNAAIFKVRQVYAGPIILDIPGYGQETATAFDAVRGTGGQVIAHQKIILSAHIYPESWNQRANRGMITADLDQLSATGHPCIVGEFGESHKPVNTDWKKLVDHARSKGWPVIGWAWNGDNSEGFKMNMITPQFQRLGSAPAKYKKSSYFDTIYSRLLSPVR